MTLRRFLLAPFAWLYGSVLLVRHGLYDAGIIKSARPMVPTIVIGNLALGGTGKTPMLELLLRTLAATAPVATLSRGYGRIGTGFHEVMVDDTAGRSGDEPLQVKRKFPGTHVFVGADRVGGIARIEQEVPGVKVVVLDDALQHRRLQAGLNILLTTWQRPWFRDALLPAGRLRDLRSRRKAAGIVVVTKCPVSPSAEESALWRERLGLTPHQQLFFAGIEYDELPPGHDGSTMLEQQPMSNLLLFTGIADPEPLVSHLRQQANIEHVAFPDHHAFTASDLERLAARFGTFAPGPKTLVTTEKDAARLGPLEGTPLEGLPLMIIGMRAVILNESERFADLIKHHVATHPAHR